MNTKLNALFDWLEYVLPDLPEQYQIDEVTPPGVHALRAQINEVIEAHGTCEDLRKLLRCSNGILRERAAVAYLSAVLRRSEALNALRGDA